jgi:hypothetical protein
MIVRGLLVILFYMSSIAMDAEWMPMLHMAGCHSVIKVHPRSPSVLAMTWESLASFDAGQTWIFLGVGVRNGREFAFGPSDPKRFYLTSWGDDDDPSDSCASIIPCRPARILSQPRTTTPS